mmetsp:Transcript_37350/g.70144  ORF Transcript_37350/g.70144 Transcript_37350/m.70144 type:complete len:270 (-) Transcript_37350:296-1105(-)
MSVALTCVLDYLYLGDRNDAGDREALQKRRVKWVVNATLEDEVPEHFPEDCTYLRLPYQDKPAEDLQREFQPVIDFILQVVPPEVIRINNKIGGGGAGEYAGDAVFVHCSYGKSRSASLVMAFLMHALRLSLRESFSQLKRLRPVLNPNVGFMKQLMAFERGLFGKATFDFERYCIEELKAMYKDTDVQATDGNAIRALRACPVNNMGLVEAMIWMEDNCRGVRLQPAKSVPPCERPRCKTTTKDISNSATSSSAVKETITAATSSPLT